MVKISSKRLDQTKGYHQRITMSTTKEEPICAYSLIREYLKVKAPAKQGKVDQFFVFADGTPVQPNHMRDTLTKLLTKAGFCADLYNTHTFRIGRCCDLLKMGFEVSTIKKIGHLEVKCCLHLPQIEVR